MIDAAVDVREISGWHDADRDPLAPNDMGKVIGQTGVAPSEHFAR